MKGERAAESSRARSPTAECQPSWRIAVFSESGLFRVAERSGTKSAEWKTSAAQRKLAGLTAIADVLAGRSLAAILLVDGIESVKLREVEFQCLGSRRGNVEREIRKANDLFAAFAARDFKFKEGHCLRRAVFLVKFKDAK
jgi:hypothetical protein